MDGYKAIISTADANVWIKSITRLKSVHLHRIFNIRLNHVFFPLKMNVLVSGNKAICWQVIIGWLVSQSLPLKMLKTALAAAFMCTNTYKSLNEL